MELLFFVYTEILDFRMYKYNTIKLGIESGGNLPVGRQAWGMEHRAWSMEQFQ